LQASGLRCSNVDRGIERARQRSVAQIGARTLQSIVTTDVTLTLLRRAEPLMRVTGRARFTCRDDGAPCQPSWQIVSVCVTSVRVSEGVRARDAKSAFAGLGDIHGDAVFSST
jgi:hypothetical protein